MDPWGGLSSSTFFIAARSGGTGVDVHQKMRDQRPLDQRGVHDVAVGRHPHVVTFAFEAVFEQFGQGQVVPLAKRLLARQEITTSWVRSHCGSHIFGELPQGTTIGQDRAPRRLGMSRSELYASAVRSYLETLRRDEVIARRIRGTWPRS